MDWTMIAVAVIAIVPQSLTAIGGVYVLMRRERKKNGHFNPSDCQNYVPALKGGE